MRPFYFALLLLPSVLTHFRDTENNIEEIHEPSTIDLEELGDPVSNNMDRIENIPINIKKIDYWMKSLSGDNEDAHLNFTGLTNKYGYTTETHTATTEDGYILTLFRIVKGKNCQGPLKKTPVLIMHGLFDSTDSFIIAGPKHAPGYILADECYDTWLLNNRGNRYSSKHTCYTSDTGSEKYWNFTYNELGNYDLKAGIDYVLEATESKQLHYIGHSQGTTNFLALASTNVEYNQKFCLAILLAPIGWLYNVEFYLLKVLASQRDLIKESLYSLSIRGLFSAEDRFGYDLSMISHLLLKSIPRELERLILLIGAGGDPEEIDSETLRAASGHFPNAVSVKDLVHLGQGVDANTFRKYDYGTDRNLEVYGTAQPPDYDIGQITAPVALFASEGDTLSDLKDVAKLVDGLPNVVYYHEMDEDWGHTHYLLARTARTKFLPSLIQLLDLSSTIHT